MTGWRAIAGEGGPCLGRLRAAMTTPGRQQSDFLLGVVRANATTSFGLSHGFSQIHTVEQFQHRVPVRTYEQHQRWIARCAEGARDELTCEPVVAFETTGGSNGGEKLIPYTTGLLGAFRDAVLPWLCDLLARRPEVGAGRAYVSASPAARPPRATPGGHPIGLPCEGAYLGQSLAAPFSQILATGAEAATARDIETWRLATLRDLVASDDLTFVSVWSPSFFTRLLDELAADPDPVMRRLSGDREAAARLAAALRGGGLRTDVLWPRLGVISCWSDGPSRALADDLAERCPHARIEPKGLLATESAVTLTLGDQPGCAPALLSAFLEFLDARGAPRLVGELEEGDDYRVVLTTPGGLYRYDIGDRLRCVGWSGAAPRLAFIGRAGLESDLVGEKLTEDFVASALARIASPTMLVAEMTPSPHYELWVDGDEPIAAAALEAALSKNPQYAYARALGQLGPIEVRAKPRFLSERHDSLVAAGLRLGDLKAQALLPWDAPGR